MAKKKAEKPETKSDFLRRVLGRNPDLDYRQVNQRWRKAGHPGEISNPLYYLIRRELGIRTEWAWVKQPPTATRELYQFRVTLLDVPPPDLAAYPGRGTGTLDKLHEHIQTAMGWTNSHLHHFRIGGTLYGDPMLMAENFGEMGYRDSTTTLLSAILPRDEGRSRSNTSTTSATAGGTRSPSRDARRPSRGRSTRSAWRARGRALPRTWAGSGATPTSSKPSPTPTTRSTTSYWSGPAARSTPSSSALRRRPGG